MPVSSAPLPRKCCPVIFPITFTCPATETFPGAVTLPLMSILAVAGSVDVTPVMRAPFPMKFPPDTTLPATVKESNDIPGITAFPVTVSWFTFNC